MRHAAARSKLLGPENVTCGSFPHPYDRNGRIMQTLQITTVLPLGVIGLAAMTICAVTIAWQLPRVRGTTLTAPFCWAVASAVALAWIEVARYHGTLETFRPLGRSVATYLAACTTFCPLMAVLGAKRPQDRAWQWIVASLWLILAAPALQSLVASSGRYLLLSGPWRWFVILLLAVSLAVYWPTRFRIAAIFATAGQVALLSPALIVAAHEHAAAMFTTGCCWLAVATVIAVRLSRIDQSQRAQQAAPRELTYAVARWLWFCDAWGALWGLRVMLRVNQTAELQNWPVRLSLGSVEVVETAATDSPAATAPQIEAALDAVLRRFERVDRARDAP